MMLRRLTYPGLLLALLICSNPAASQQASLTVFPDSVSIGEVFEVAVTIARPPGTQVIFPEPPRGAARLEAPLRSGDAELLDVRRFAPAERGGLRVDSAIYRAAVFSLDEAVIGPVRLLMVQKADTLQIATPVARVPVRSAAPPNADELVGPAPLAEFPRGIGVWLAGFLVGMVLILIAVALLRRRRRPARYPTSSLPPIDEARRHIASMRGWQPEDEISMRAFFVELSDLLRTYIGRTSDIPAREMTTREIETALSARDIPREHQQSLLMLLREADLVKFARHQPSPDRPKAALSEAAEVLEAFEERRQTAIIEEHE